MKNAWMEKYEKIAIAPMMQKHPDQGRRQRNVRPDEQHQRKKAARIMQRREWHATFANRLGEIVENQKLDYQAVDIKAGLNKGTVSSYMTGHATPLLYTAQKIADALGVGLEELIGNDGGPKTFGRVSHDDLLSVAVTMIIETGSYKEDFLLDPPRVIHIGRCREFPLAPHYLAEVRDFAMAAASWPNLQIGADALCVEVVAKLGMSITHDRPCVIRRRKGSLLETLARRVLYLPDGRIELRAEPPSHLKNHFPPIFLDSLSTDPAADVFVCGFIVGVLQTDH